MKTESKQKKRLRRHKRVRAKIFGTIKRPRLSIYRSHKHIYAQIINDEKEQTLVAASDQELKLKKKTPVPKKQDSLNKIEKEKTKNQVKSKKIIIAFEVGKLIAEKALKKKISKVIFDRGGYKYHGRVKSMADGARKGGLKF